MDHYSFIYQAFWDALPEGNVNIRFYASDSAGNIGSTDLTVSKQLIQEPSKQGSGKRKLGKQEPDILEFLTSPAGLITMSILALVAIGVIVVIKKKVFNKSTDKEIKRIEKILE